MLAASLQYCIDSLAETAVLSATLIPTSGLLQHTKPFAERLLVLHSTLGCLTRYIIITCG